jgi:hypothetical protein
MLQTCSVWVNQIYSEDVLTRASLGQQRPPLNGPPHSSWGAVVRENNIKADE